jgi:hypothetical protein
VAEGKVDRSGAARENVKPKAALWQTATIDAPESPQWAVTFPFMRNPSTVSGTMSSKPRVAALLSAAAFAFAAYPANARSDIQWDRPAPPAYNQPGYNQNDPYRPLPEARLFAPREVEAMVAPIALFPDSLVAQILMAATYPYDVEDAANWVADPRNGRLVGYALSDALDGMDWDPSVKALTAAPDVLRMMDERRDWTANLGQAFTADQGMVMDAVQHLRRQARATGRLNSDRYRRILDRGGEIVIEPVSADEMYFQFYDPRVAYGAWAYDDYPPYYFPPVYYQVVRPIPIFGPLWGWSSWDWRGRSLHLDVNRWRSLNHNRPSVIVGNTWRHDGARNRDRDFRNRPNRTNFDPGRRTPEANDRGRGFENRPDGRNEGRIDGNTRERGRGFQGRQPEAQPAPSANASPAPPENFRGRSFRDLQDSPRRDGGQRNREAGREQAGREPSATQPNAVQPTPTQPDPRQTNEGRFNRGEPNGGARGDNRGGRGDTGEGGRQRRQEANVAPTVIAPQAPAVTPQPQAAPPGGRYRGDRPQTAAEAPRGNEGGPRGGRFNGGPPNANPQTQPQAPAAQPQPQPQNGDDNPRRGRNRGDGPPNR